MDAISLKYIIYIQIWSTTTNWFYYFAAEIKESELMIKRLSKSIAFFDSFRKSLIVLSVTNGSISITLFATVIEAPIAIVSASFSLELSISTETVKKPVKNSIK